MEGGDGKGVQTQSSCVNEVRLDLVPDYEKKTHDREVRLYILHYLINSALHESATPF